MDFLTCLYVFLVILITRKRISDVMRVAIVKLLCPIMSYEANVGTAMCAWKTVISNNKTLVRTGVYSTFFFNIIRYN